MDQPGFFATLWAAAPERSRVSRYTELNGYGYLLVGLGLFASPAAILTMLTGAGDDFGSVRLMGMMLGFIGWFYVIGGRTGRASFALSTVVDRLLVPFFLGGLILLGEVTFQKVGAVLVVDPLLGLGALFLWWTDR